MIKTQVFHPDSTSTSKLSRALSLLSAGFLGVLVVGGVGFADMPAVHDAAHDVRHSLAFPCH